MLELKLSVFPFVEGGTCGGDEGRNVGVRGSCLPQHYEETAKYALSLHMHSKLFLFFFFVL